MGLSVKDAADETKSIKSRTDGTDEVLVRDIDLFPTFGETDDTAATSGSDDTTAMAFFKGMLDQLVELVGKATGLPNFSSAVTVNVTTDGTAGTFTNFASQSCTYLDIINETGVAIRVREEGETAYIIVADGTTYPMFPITNANEVEVSLDSTGSTVVVRARAYVA